MSSAPLFPAADVAASIAPRLDGSPAEAGQADA
jgi:hypothetical protein